MSGVDPAHNGGVAGKTDVCAHADQLLHVHEPVSKMVSAMTPKPSARLASAS